MSPPIPCLFSLCSPQRYSFRPELRSLLLFKVNLDSLFQEMGRRPFPLTHNLNLTWFILLTSNVWYPKQMLSLLPGPCPVPGGTSRSGMWKDREQEILHKLYTPNDKDPTQPTPRVGGVTETDSSLGAVRSSSTTTQRLLCSHLKVVPVSAETFSIADHPWSRKFKSIRDGTDFTNALR